MSGIRSRGRRGSTSVPNWRCEDTRLDVFDFRVAVWLASHADTYLADNVGRNEIVSVLGISRAKVSDSLSRLQELGIIELIEAPNGRGGGFRWVIVFDWDVWETEPDVGRHTSSGRTPDVQQVGRQASSSIGEQDLETNTRDDAFENLWKLYPRKEAKKQARAQWSKMSPADRQHALAQLPAWLKNRDPKFAPYLQRWLRDHRWEDEPARPGSASESRRGGPPERPPGVHPSAKWNGTKWEQPF